MSILFPLPETKAEVVRALVLEDLSRITSYPVVLPSVQDQLNRVHAKQERRKYLSQPVTPTAFGELA